MGASRPPKPSSWSWKCHSCGHTYTIAATRRCLKCSHRSCVGTAPTKDNNFRVCHSEFDYAAWASLGELRRRREHCASDAAVGRRRQSKKKMEEARIKRFVDKTHDCSRDCDYPSQCNHERRRETMSQVEPSPAESPTTTEKPDDWLMVEEAAPYETVEAEEWFLTSCESSDSDGGSDEEIDRGGELDALAEAVRRGDSFLGDSNSYSPCLPKSISNDRFTQNPKQTRLLYTARSGRRRRPDCDFSTPLIVPPKLLGYPSLMDVRPAEDASS
ncbi:hypothetical protein G7Z17_g6907 [Cylindrodendrum hubeiense]|uniref:Uncharacterized protein n=1 Tax=Cylindrodendrum hubeiense TaxID=595255 RepID=A0A9P5LAE1_9HYPO|nr:hypothetical protein G7Z17_g6907 [Cylindrodendrum hubeiense]